jgi:hypothetical protein
VSYIDFDAVHKRMIEADLIEDWLDRNFGFEQSFGTERKYQNYLQRKLSEELKVQILSEVSRESGYLRGKVDLYIPCVNAVIECKKHKRDKKTARQQLDYYGRLFNTDLLFFAAADDPSTGKYIVDTLIDIVENNNKQD